MVSLQDTLAAVLNICAQEELNKSADESSQSTVAIDREKAERRKVIKNKIAFACCGSDGSADLAIR
jgi:hypothetical protein